MKVIGIIFSLSGGQLIMAVALSTFFLIGCGTICYFLWKKRRDGYLKKYGLPTETDFLRVELNTNLEVNGQHPFRVLTQWKNPVTSDMHIFHSGNIWFDPSKYLEGTKIIVYMERNNPRKYYLDLSFLPKVVT
jgi:hypothetical protein